MAPIVALIRCGSYSDDEVASAVGRALSMIGGIESFVKPGNRVLIKPNLLSASDPELAISTHPAVVKAVVRLVQAAGGQPIIADSPGGTFTRTSLEVAYTKTRMAYAAEETGAALNYDTDSVQVPNPEGKIVKRLDVIKILTQVDVVISLPKMKTHLFTEFTGATKNLFGTVPGLTKAAYHLKFQSVDLFCDMLLDVLTYVKPSFSLMDAVVGMEGDGPGTHGRPKEARLILASADAVALDVVATSVIGMEPLDVPILEKARQRGMTSGKLDDVIVVGEKVADVMVPFAKPKAGSGILAKLMTSPIVRGLLLKHMAAYPVANASCVRCGICAQCCPASAITIKDKAHMDLGKCIRCYCCHEMCPHRAIDLRRGLFSRFFR